MADADARRAARTFDLTDWVCRAGVALLFADVGCEKLFAGPGSYWVPLFAQIGFGQWFRTFTGAIQVLGAALILIPRTALAGAALLAATMFGAVLCHLFLLNTGIGGALIPAVILFFVVATAARRMRQPGADPPLRLR